MTRSNWKLLEYMDAQLIDRAVVDIGHDRLGLAPRLALMGKAKKARPRTPQHDTKEYWRHL